ncbi:hypothetical protein J4209_02085 [Candidatus Woesearchaeota archaeon]|nr:hypothetical protein [Candidatus Woesearchaeota archaeon]
MTEARELQKGMYINYNNEIFRVIRKELVAYGTHSHSKTKLFIQPLLGKGEKAINLMHHDNVETVDIIRKDGQVISKSGNKVQIMDSHSYETVDADIIPELADEIKEGDNITFINFKNNALVLEKRG